jgi:hypothetical protein
VKRYGKYGRNSKSNSGKIWTIWKKGKLECEMIWKILKKGKSKIDNDMDNIEEN